MTDDTDFDLDETDAEAREWFRREVRTRGLRIAYKALTDACQDPKGNATAKAAAGRAIFQAAGVLEKASEAPIPEIHQMTAAQLEQEITRLRGRQTAVGRKRISPATDGDGDAAVEPSGNAGDVFS